MDDFERASARTHALTASDPKPEPSEDDAPDSGTPFDDDSTFDDGAAFD